MKTYLAVLIFSALGAYFLTPFAGHLALRWGAIDQPGGRKIHKKPMARLGGLAVFGGFCIPWITFYFYGNRVSSIFLNYEKLFYSLMIGGVAMLGLGIYDDIKGANASKKFLVQIGVAVWLYFAGYQITRLSNPFGAPFELGWLSFPVTILWIVGLTNAFNLLDGIDGLATGVAICTSLALALINILGDKVLVGLLTLSLAGACLGFLPHNFSPARIFLGDTGSLFIGLVLSCIGILSLFKAATVTFVVVPVALFGLPLFDTLSVMAGRLWRGKPLFHADKTHVHHRLLRLGWNQKETAIFLWGVTLVLGTIAVDLSIRQSLRTVLFGVSMLAVLLFTIWHSWRRREEAAEAAAKEENNAKSGGGSTSRPGNDPGAGI